MNEIVATVDSDLSVMRAPQAVVDEAKIAARVLTDIIEQKKKPVKFNGEQYLEFEDWQTIGKFYGLACRTLDPEPMEIRTDDGLTVVGGAKARAEVVEVKSGRVIGTASAWCLRDEPNWKHKPWFQLASMAQTRAGARAMRNLLSWVVVLAGYKTTPAEEMTEVTDEHEHHNENKRRNVPAPAADDGMASRLVADILGKLVEMAQGEEAEAANHLRLLTEYEKDGKTNWVKISDLDRISKSNPKWIKVINDKVNNAYAKHKSGN